MGEFNTCKYCGRHRESECELLGCCIDCAHDKKAGNHTPMIVYYPKGASEPSRTANKNQQQKRTGGGAK